MCFSKEVSLFTFLTGVIGGLLCYSTGIADYKIIGLFFAFISLMQGIEYFLWKHQICDDYNKFLSTLGMILNHLQPVVLYILLYIFNEKIRENNALKILLLIYILVIIPYSLQFKFECTLKQNEHLYWKWNGKKYNFETYTIFLFCLVVFGFFFPNLKVGISFSIIAFVGYILSYFIYGNSGTVGSMWCFISAFAPIIYYLLMKMNVV